MSGGCESIAAGFLENQAGGGADVAAIRRGPRDVCLCSAKGTFGRKARLRSHCRCRGRSFCLGSNGAGDASPAATGSPRSPVSQVRPRRLLRRRRPSEQGAAEPSQGGRRACLLVTTNNTPCRRWISLRSRLVLCPSRVEVTSSVRGLSTVQALVLPRAPSATSARQLPREPASATQTRT